MKLTKISASVALALLATCHSSSWALGLGEAKALSPLNHPLKAEVEILADAAELSSLKLSLASPDAYRQQGLDYPSALKGANVNVVKRGSRAVAMITSTASIQEPYVPVVLDGESVSGKVRRVYSVFIDPALVGSQAEQKLPGDSSFAEVKQKLPILPPLTKTEKVARVPDQLAVASSVAAASNTVSASQPMAGGAVALYTNISEVGKAPARIDRVLGYGKNVSAKHALFTLAPKGWRGFAGHPTLKLEGNVSWNAGQNWVHTLDGILADLYLRANIDWNKKEITFFALDDAKLEVASTAKVVESASVADEKPAVKVAASQERNARDGVDLEQARKQMKQAENELGQARISASEPAASRTEVATSTDVSAKTKAAVEAHRQEQAHRDEAMAKISAAKLAIDKAALQDVSAKLKASQDALKVAQAERDKAVTSLAEANAKLQAVKASSSKDKELSDKLKAAQDALKHAEADRDQAVAKLAQASAASHGKATAKDLDVKLKTAEEELKRAQADRDEAAAKLAEANAKVHSLEQALAEARSSEKALTAKVNELRDQLTATQAKAAADGKSREHYQAQIKHLHKMLEVTQERLTRARWGVPAPQPVQSTSLKSIKMVDGEMTPATAVVSGGFNVPLSTALNQVVPSGWMVITNPDAGNPVVGWAGKGRAWTEVLDEILSAQKLVATVDPVAREIQVSATGQQ